MIHGLKFSAQTFKTRPDVQIIYGIKRHAYLIKRKRPMVKRTNEEYLELVKNVYLTVDALKFRNPDMEQRFKSDLSREEYELKLKLLIVDDMAEVDDQGYFELKPIETDSNTPISDRTLKKIHIADAWKFGLDLENLTVPDPVMEHIIFSDATPEESIRMVKIMLMDGCKIEGGCLLRGESGGIADSPAAPSTRWQ